MATLYEYFNSGDDAQYFIFGVNWYAQTFTPSTSHTITSVKLKLAKSGSPTGNLTVAIRATDDDGKPTGDNLCSGAKDATELTTTPTWYEITLGSGTPLLTSIKYAIVVSCPTATDGNMPLWRDKSTGGYAGGSMANSSDSGSSWATSPDIDFMFEEWGEPTVVAPTVTTDPATDIT